MSRSSAGSSTADSPVTWPLDPRDFSSWHEYYWTYQYQLAAKFLMPLIEKWGIEFHNARILDVGCGDGGFTAAMADRGARCVGVEIREFHRKPYGNKRLHYVVADATAADAPSRLGQDYDLVVLRDVIEHIPLERKEVFLQSLKRFLKANGKMFLTFPPFYSPFGLHQQTLLKSKLRRMPFLHYLPLPLLHEVMAIMHEPPASYSAVDEIVRCKMTIGQFRTLMRKTGLRILHEEYYLVRPSHEIRFGWKTRRALVGMVPLFGEVLVSGAALLVTPCR